MSTIRDLIRQLKSQIRITDVIELLGAEVVRKGTDTWQLRCFLHEDKAPSLCVTLSNGLYHCFSTGCGNSGDLVSFYQFWHHMEPAEAALALARDFGIDTAPFQRGTQPQEQRLVDFMSRFTQRLHDNLLKHRPAMEYLSSRGVNEETIKAFKVGFSHRVAGEPELSADEFQALNLGRRDLYDKTFIFPVEDPFSKKIFHYARPWSNEQKGPKYIGASGAHPLRWKGAMFGLQVARQQVRASKAKQVVMVEGFFDVLALHSRGIPYAVCLLGSKLAHDQIDALTRYGIKNATVLFDADKAGDEGVEKIIKEGHKDLKLKITYMPEGDPDEYIIKYGKEAIESLLEEAVSPIEFVIDRLAFEESADFYDRVKQIKSIAPLIAKMGPAEQAVAMRKLGAVTQVPTERLWDLFTEEQSDNRKIVDAEREVLASCIHRPEDYALVLSRLPSSDGIWTSHSHESIWSALSTLYAKGVTRIEKTQLAERIDALILDRTWDREGTNLEYNLTIMLDAAVRRRLHSTAKKLASAVGNTARPVGDIISEHLVTVSSQAAPTDKLEFNAEEQVESAMEYVHERMAAGGTFPGIDLGKGWKQLMSSVLGFQPGYLYLMAAGPKAGKTATAQNWALRCAVLQGIPTLWLNLEMGKRDLALRNLSILSGLSNSRIRMGKITEEEKVILDEAAIRYHQAPFHMVSAAGMSVQEIINVSRKYVHAHGIKIIFLDYIQLIKIGAAHDQLWEGHMEVSTALKNAVSKDLQVPLIAVSQLNRNANLEGSASGNNIGGSYKYVQDCDCYMGLRRLTKKEAEDGMGGNSVLDLEFNRHGPQDLRLRLFFNRDNLRVEEC